MKRLEGLQPAGVFHFFEELCAIPHGSGNTEQISDYCARFAAARGLFCRQDAAHNVIIIKPATPGYEAAPAVILQGHLDMVCEKAPDCALDMAKEGLSLRVEGDKVWAEGTTLGGDDGIAVAMALAVLDAKDLPHPRIEAVFTTDEEIGMLGAAALDASPLQGRWLINIDSEEEGVFTVSCAGGNRTVCTLPVEREAYAGDRLLVQVSGLLGGHSGMEIHKGRANANVLMARVLHRLCGQENARLVRVDGGTQDNAIPVAATAVLAAPNPDALRAAAARLEADFCAEYRAADPGVRVSVTPCEDTLPPMVRSAQQKVIAFLLCAPDGVQAMSGQIHGLVQTSLNLGILRTQTDNMTAAFCIRSSMATQKQLLCDRLCCLAGELGGDVEVFGDYPAWEYNPDSRLRELMRQVFVEQYGREPKVEAVHAGLECGLLCGKLPGLDCVSIGPELREIHTCRESLSIASVQRVYAFLLECLRRAC